MSIILSYGWSDISCSVRQMALGLQTLSFRDSGVCSVFRTGLKFSFS